MFVDLISKPLLGGYDALELHLVRVSTFLSLFLQAILNVVLDSFFIVFLFLDKIIFTEFSI